MDCPVPVDATRGIKPPPPSLLGPWMIFREVHLLNPHLDIIGDIKPCRVFNFGTGIHDWARVYSIEGLYTVW